MGIPVVALDATGTRDALAPGLKELAVAADEWEELVEVINRLLGSPELRERLGTGARGWVVEHFDRERLWAELARNYDKWMPAAASERKTSS
jgi:glycosyltransferase involved in cell wall biosynthesis